MPGDCLVQHLPTFSSCITNVIEGILTLQRRLEYILLWEMGVLSVSPELYRQDSYKGKAHLNDAKNKWTTQWRKEVENGTRWNEM